MFSVLTSWSINHNDRQALRPGVVALHLQNEQTSPHFEPIIFSTSPPIPILSYPFTCDNQADHNPSRESVIQQLTL